MKSSPVLCVVVVSITAFFDFLSAYYTEITRSHSAGSLCFGVKLGLLSISRFRQTGEEAPGWALLGAVCESLRGHYVRGREIAGIGERADSERRSERVRDQAN